VPLITIWCKNQRYLTPLIPKPFGADQWTEDMVEKYELKATARKRGRQIKGT